MKKQANHGKHICIKDAIKRDGNIGAHFSPRYLAIKLLEHDREVEDMVRRSPDH